MNFKRLLFFILIVASTGTHAVQYAQEGRVADLLLRTGADYDGVLYVSGFSAAGSCRTWRNHVVIAMPDDEKSEARFSMILALKLADQNVHVRVDDTKKLSDGTCILQDIRLDSDF